MKKSISNKSFLHITDNRCGQMYFGCNQEWFGTKWQRLAGCGPSVASNIFGYLFKLKKLNNQDKPYEKNEFMSLMEELWCHVTPTIRGVNTTAIFYKGLISYAKEKGLPLRHHFLNIPERKEARPSFKEVVSFIANGLDQDTPVAFLNLCNGKEKALDKWHWVTIVSMDYAEDFSGAVLESYDEGKIKHADLKLWYDTTCLGGGFVYAVLDIG
ncbi:MAG: hypothetical protein ACOX3Q_09060 [Clostridia bacterium]|jgi:hypothetical protein|nr:hypothetical protein [Clostridiaceae bacterium]